MQQNFSIGISWEDAQGLPLRPYSVTLADGRVVVVNPKRPETHDSWSAVQADPAYHYNLGTILLNPDEVLPDTSQNPRAIRHRQEGEVLTYSKFGYINSLNMPSSWQFPTDKTVVTVKFTSSGNHTLTSQIFRSW